MIYTVTRIKNVTFPDNDNKQISLPGYAFIDVNGHTIIQVYGTKKVKLVKEYINETT